MRQLAKKILLSTAQAVPGVPLAARLIHGSTPSHRGTYAYFRRLFIANGAKTKYDSSVRQRLVEKFEAVDLGVKAKSTPVDGLVLAEAMLSMDAEGDVVECGCYMGTSTAKLSLVARVLGRKLIVFDSFEGLPEGGDRIIHARNEMSDERKWTAGDLSASEALVRRNVETYGDISVCTFIKGWFSQTLTPENLPGKISVAFTDVDLKTSTRECLLAIWPLLAERGVYFSHDVAYLNALQQLCDEDLWMNELKCFPPILFGAGFGTCDLSPHLGYMVKGKNLSAEFLKSLTLNK